MNDLKRILLVEDDPKDVELTLTGLAEYNLANEVVVARDGEEALSVARQARPDLLAKTTKPAPLAARWPIGRRAPLTPW